MSRGGTGVGERAGERGHLEVGAGFRILMIAVAFLHIAPCDQILHGGEAAVLTLHGPVMSARNAVDRSGDDVLSSPFSVGMATSVAPPSTIQSRQS